MLLFDSQSKIKRVLLNDSTPNFSITYKEFRNTIDNVKFCAETFEIDKDVKNACDSVLKNKFMTDEQAELISAYIFKYQDENEF
jgi:hypothetical protein